MSLKIYLRFFKKTLTCHDLSGPEEGFFKPPHFEKEEGVGSEKKYLGGLKEFLPHICARGTYYVSCQIKCKIKYCAEGSISYLDGLFQPNNLLMLFW